MSPGWRRKGGNRLELNELRCFNTETALVLYCMHNECNKQVIFSELSNTLELASNEERGEEKEFLFANKDIPFTTTIILMPKVPVQDTLCIVIGIGEMQTKGKPFALS